MVCVHVQLDRLAKLFLFVSRDLHLDSSIDFRQFSNCLACSRPTCFSTRQPPHKLTKRKIAAKNEQSCCYKYPVERYKNRGKKRNMPSALPLSLLVSRQIDRRHQHPRPNHLRPKCQGQIHNTEVWQSPPACNFLRNLKAEPDFISIHSGF